MAARPNWRARCGLLAKSYGDQASRDNPYCRLQRACQQAAQNRGSTMQKNSLGRTACTAMGPSFFANSNAERSPYSFPWTVTAPLLKKSNSIDGYMPAEKVAPASRRMNPRRVSRSVKVPSHFMCGYRPVSRHTEYDEGIGDRSAV